MGKNFAEPKYHGVIMPVLMECWKNTNDDNPEIFSLFNCFIQIAKAMEGHFAPYAPPIYHRYWVWFQIGL
jgi:hypothetical protein